MTELQHSTSPAISFKPMLPAAKSDVWLIGCEESQAVTIELRKLGIEAYSCDLMECSGNHPEWHLQMDVFKAIKKLKPKVGIFFPPCTYLTIAANRHVPGNPERWQKMVNALKFVYELMQADIEYMAIENPVGVISSFIRKPDQIFNPFDFGDPVPKKTCLWLKNLPLLKHTRHDNLFEAKTAVEPEYIVYNSKRSKSGTSKYSIYGAMSSGRNPEVAKLRAKTFPSVAKAMAEQWTEAVIGCR